jgi:outer membrane protein assembly factor BamB
MAADGLIYAINDTGLLRMIELTPEKYRLLGQAQVLQGHDSWGPLAIAGGRLLARDLTRMVCLEAR